MQNQTSIWETKAAYEAYSRSALRSPYLLQLVRNNKSYRHVLRFLGHIIMFASGIYLMRTGYSISPMAAVLLYPFYLFFQALILSGLMIHSHELSHNHIRSKGLNDFIANISGWLCFINFYSFQRAHRLHHRNIGNLDTPEAGAPVSPKGQKKILHEDKSNKMIGRMFDRSYLLGFLSSWPIFIYYGDYNSWILPYREKGRLQRGSLVSFVLFLGLNLTFIVLFPWLYLFLFFIPMLLGGQRILAITYMHHAHEDSVFFSEEHHNFHTIMMSTTDRDYGWLVNFFMLNNGYHIPHHLNPQIAYYDLKKASQYLRENLPQGLSYNYQPKSRFYMDFASGLYEQRLEQDYEYYQITFLKPDLPGAGILRSLKR